MRPLDGVRVLDFTTLLPGPMATLLLAEGGANVIKVERPGRGDEMRHYPPRWGQSGVNFALLNRGKRSVTADLKNSADRRKIRSLAEECDVLIEQFRPGVMARLELDYETISKSNPKLIYCSITAFGQFGAKRNVAAHDLNIIADVGLLSLTPQATISRSLPPTFIADIAGGTYPAVINVLLALWVRDATGKGLHLDVSMADNVFPLMFDMLGRYHVHNSGGHKGTSLVAGNTPRYRLYPTKDGRILAAAPIEQKFWDKFCHIISLEPSLRNDQADPVATVKAVERIIQGRASKYWSDVFANQDCCCTVVASLEEAMDNSHFRERNLFTQAVLNENGETVPALPLPLDLRFRGLSNVPVAAPPLKSITADFEW